MRILQLITSMDARSGGPCQFIKHSSKQLEAHNVFNEVVCLDDMRIKEHAYEHLTIHTLGPGKGNWSYSKKLAPWLNQNLQRFDAVIVNGLWQYQGYALRKVFEKYKKRQKKVPKLFIIPHGMLDPYFQKAKGRKLKAIRNWFYWKLIESKLINCADALLFSCEQEMELAKKAFSPYAPSKELNVGIGIYPPPAYTQEMKESLLEICPELNNDTPYILFLGRIDPKKGLDILIRAYLDLKTKGFDLPKLVVAGPGDDAEYGKKMIQLASVDANIIFTGMIAGNAKWGALYGCDAFVLSSHQENFGISIVEAMACKKPVLITNKVNIHKEIEASGAGLVAEDTVADTKSMLRKWVSLKMKEKKEMAMHAHQAFHKYFEINVTNNKLRDVLLQQFSKSDFSQESLNSQ